MSRYVVIGAGAIGVTLAAELHRCGNAVALIARGAQLHAARSTGITYVRPDGSRPLAVAVHGGPDELTLTEGDVLVLATKTQDAAAAIETWSRQPVAHPDGRTTTAGETLLLLTTQNGLETERVALRYFRSVVGGVLALAAHHVEPGVVVAPGAPAVGLAWIGAYPDREEPVVEELARRLRRANVETRVVSDISAWKNAKLVLSSTFVLDALFEPSALRDQAAALLREEATAVLLAGGHAIADLGGDFARRSHRSQLHPTEGYEYRGSSTWQSIARSSSVETDFLNGEVVLQARLAGRTAPSHEAVLARMDTVLRDGLPARALSDEDLRATFPTLSDAVSASPRAQILVTPMELHRCLRGAMPPAVLDVRWKLGDPDGRRHYADGHLPTAVYVDLDTELAAPASPADGRHPLPEIADLQDAARRWGLTEGQSVVVYDDAGGLAAARAWWLLRWAGIQDVRILDGALSGWVQAGLPLESGDPATPPGDAATGDVTLTAGHLPVLDADEAARLPEEGVLLDARAAERYSGEQEPIDPRAGHIPGAISVPTTDSLAADGRFLSDDLLRERFATLGVDGEQPIGVYCGSGVTATHLLAALAVAGLDGALFPGSWSAWSADSSRPLAVGALPY